MLFIFSQADGTANCDEEADEKGQDNSDFPARTLDLELDELRNREQEDD